MLYRNNPNKLKECLIEFDFDDENDDVEIEDKDIEKAILTISSNKFDIIQSIKYLGDKNLLDFRNDGDNVSGIFLNIILTHKGIDIIENIDRGIKEKQEFNIIFNIKVENHMNVESLLKAQLGSLFSLFGGLQ